VGRVLSADPLWDGAGGERDGGRARAGLDVAAAGGEATAQRVALARAGLLHDVHGRIQRPRDRDRVVGRVAVHHNDLVNIPRKTRKDVR